VSADAAVATVEADELEALSTHRADARGRWPWPIEDWTMIPWPAFCSRWGQRRPYDHAERGT